MNVHPAAVALTGSAGTELVERLLQRGLRALREVSPVLAAETLDSEAVLRRAAKNPDAAARRRAAKRLPFVVYEGQRIGTWTSFQQDEDAEVRALANESLVQLPPDWQSAEFRQALADRIRRGKIDAMESPRLQNFIESSSHPQHAELRKLLAK